MRLVADEAGIDVLVRIAVLQHRGHMLSALVSESPIADERLLQRQREIGDLGHGAREVRRPRKRRFG